MGLWYEPNLLIDGELVPAEGGATFASINPATEEVIAEAADASVADVERAIAAARRAFDETTWSTDAKFRATCLRQLAAAMRDNLEDLRTLTIAEVGVPRRHDDRRRRSRARSRSSTTTPISPRSTSRSTDLGCIEAYGSQHRRWIEREPYGVVSAISAYNYPTQLNLAKLAPALAAGCTVVLKGAPDTPLITLALGKLIAENTDIPAGVVSVLTSSKVETGVVMTTDPDVDMITFTGSTPVGKAITAAASDTLKKTFLELGGKSACLVLDDESVDFGVMMAAMATCSHAGQGCAILSRLAVPRAQVRRRGRDGQGDDGRPQRRRPERSGQLPRTADQRQAAREGAGHGRPRGRRRRDGRHRRHGHRPREGLLLQADDDHRRRREQRDRPGRGVRPGARDLPARRRRRCGALRQQLEVRVVGRA